VTPRKEFVRPGDPRELTREEALALGRALFDALQGDRETAQEARQGDCGDRPVSGDRAEPCEAPGPAES
jgi:hypothetical protein